MKVKELIERLSKFDGEKMVVVYDNDGFPWDVRVEDCDDQIEILYA